MTQSSSRPEPGRIFGTLHPFFEGGLLNGRTLANAGFMEALLALDPFDQYHFFVANPAELQAQWEQRAHLPALKRGGAHALQRVDLTARLRDTAYHVFHLSDPVVGFADACALRNENAPAIFPVTAVTHSISYQEYAAAFLGHLWEGCSPRDALGTNSRAALEVMRGWYGHLRAVYGLDATRCPGPELRVMPMGVDPTVLPQTGDARERQRAALRQRLGLTEQSFLLLLFGRLALDDKMDPQPLLMAVRRARAQFPDLDARLLISGYTRQGDPLPDFLRAVAHMLNIPVHVLPNPSPEEKYACFAAADAFVSPSDNIQETFGLSLLEAGSASLPVIAADWDGYRDIVEHEVTGLRVPTLAPVQTPTLDALTPALFDNQHHYLRSQRVVVLVPALAEAIARLAGDAELRARMGAAARARVLERFTWEAVVRNWLVCWEELRSRPLSADVEARLRAARHPLRPSFGALFAHYATGHLAPHTRLLCSHVGTAVREGRLPWEVAGKPPPGLQQDSLRALLVLTRKPATMAELTPRLGLGEEALHAHILWALKHDLVQAE